MAIVCRWKRPFGELAANLIDRHEGVRALVRVGTEDDHALASGQYSRRAPDRLGDTPASRAQPGSSQNTPDGPTNLAGGGSGTSDRGTGQRKNEPTRQVRAMMTYTRKKPRPP